MTKSALIDVIKTKWEEAERERIALNDFFAETPKVQEARQLEQLLSDRFESSIERFQCGLISTSEMLTKLNYLASLPIEEGE